MNVNFVKKWALLYKMTMSSVVMRLFTATAWQDIALKILYLDAGLLLGFHVVSRFIYVSADFVITF
jgi:hypothetical protein